MSALRDLIQRTLDAAPPMRTDDLATTIESVMLLETGGGEHVVRVEGFEWVMQHPLTERFEPEGTGTSLLDCKYNLLVDAAVDEGHVPDGEWFMWLDPSGVLLWRERTP